MDDALDAFSIDEFCQRHRFSRGTYYNLLKDGKAPKFFTVGSRRFISREAADAWRQQCEADAPAAYQAACERRRAARARAAEAKLAARAAVQEYNLKPEQPSGKRVMPERKPAANK